MSIEILAKKILTRSNHPDSWFDIKYNLNIYRGCELACAWCDSRSNRYGLDNFDNVQVKVNTVELLQRELASKRNKGVIGIGSFSDPYTFAEKDYKLTRASLQTISQFRFPVHIKTKNDLILRDLDVIKEISRVHSSVAFTITTTDDELASRIEPGASSISRRLEAIKKLASEGVYVGILLFPIFPFILDNKENIVNVVRAAADNGAHYIIPWFGMTLRDTQRDYFYSSIDKVFPDIKSKYEKTFGNSYYCKSSNAGELEQIFKEECSKHNIITSMKEMKKYRQVADFEQLSLFEN
ncbi:MULTISPECIES: SPL family radical SAM protein [Bacillus cereus group]|uniref:Radical SAM protein n=2 Tax=Bacillus cereus group TaxID=86661 RepID=A0A1C3ZZA8_BACTU|nr:MULTISPECIES: radical SAM protein [Bacillus cereus group]MED3024754.1 radical SAM protein [Bacillus wiedmannii]OTX97406.1 radical SAM protein [Bacillus thuringiensis serovar wratislaviensis]OUB62080.1 radical SAM protein [Bacillus thuringiensis serovar sylvestriensis]QHV02372.1 radical SAM protein [Bacillus cereus]QHV43056.1 radical SAM protein [Bacillus cereus]